MIRSSALSFVLGLVALLAADVGSAEARRSRKRPSATLSFTEVNPRVSSPAFRKYIGKALAVLRRSRRKIARATLWAINRGKVKIDTLNDLTRPDFHRVRRDLNKDGVNLKVSDFAILHDRRTKASRAIRKTLYGYQWDNRIYVSEGLTPLRLAITLVHEVNHVINKSEENYRGNKAILREEYRAMYSERLFRGIKMTARRSLALKKALIRDYTIKGVTPADVTDRPPGRFFPRGWRPGL